MTLRTDVDYGDFDYTDKFREVTIPAAEAGIVQYIPAQGN
jgi:hypothetical protein